MILHGRVQSIVGTGLEKLPVFIVYSDLPSGFCFIFLRKFAEIQLITEGTLHCTDASGLERRYPAVLMVRANGHMGRHGRHGITEGGSIMNTKSLDGIGVVAAPDLRRIIQHTGIETSASSAAALQQKVRMAGQHIFHHLVKAKHIFMADGSLAESRICSAVYIIHTAVHIPFYIGNVCTRKSVVDEFLHIFPYFFSGKIQDQLVTAAVGLPSRNLEYPVGVHPVKLTVLRNHLRLQPDTKFQAKGIHPVYQFFHGAAQFFLIYKPVTKAGIVIVSFSKPAVVQYQHIEAQICCLSCNFQQFFRIEAKISGLPVVYQGRTLFVFPGAADQVGMISLLELVREYGQTFFAVAQSSFRCHKGLARSQFPQEFLVVQAADKTNTVHLVFFHLDLETAAVDKGNAVSISEILGGVFVAEDHKRVVVMAGSAAAAADLGDAVGQISALKLTLAGVFSIEMNEIHIAFHEIQAKA